jgi:hypothetical protein
MFRYAEPLIWISGLLALYLLPFGADTGTICLFHWLGFNTCPGCGLGRSIHHALHGELQQSLSTHYLGIPVLLALLWRSATPLFPPTKKEIPP